MEQIQEDDSNFNGWRFCQECENLLIPVKGNTDEGEGQNIVTFFCNSCTQRKGRTVSIIMDIDKKKTNNIEQFLMKRTVLERTKAADIFNKDMVLDPTMQTQEIECPKCGYEQAVFYLKTDNNEPQIIQQFICSRGALQGFVQCAFTWNKNTLQKMMEQQNQNYNIDQSMSNLSDDDLEQKHEYENDDDLGASDDDNALFGQDEQMLEGQDNLGGKQEHLDDDDDLDDFE